VTARHRAPRGAPDPTWSEARQEWQVRIELPTNPGQPRNRKWVRAKTKAECLEKLRKAQVSVAEVGVLPDDSGTLGAVARDWLHYMEHRVVAESWSAYRTRVNLHILPMLGSRRLTALTTSDVDQWQEDLKAKGLAVSTRSEIRSTLVIIIEWAQGRDLVMRNVAALSSGPRGTGKKVESLTKPQAKDVLSAVSGWRLEAAVVLMMTTGLRIGECLGLRWSDITDGTVTITGQLVTKPALHYQAFPKTSQSFRRVDLPLRALNALEAHREQQDMEREALGLEPADYIFMTASQRLLDPSTLASELKARTAHLGVNVHPHKLRHTAASLMIDAGVPIEIVSKVLGHRSIRTTLDIYGHLLDRGRGTAASAMDETLG